MLITNSLVILYHLKSYQILELILKEYNIGYYTDQDMSSLVAIVGFTSNYLSGSLATSSLDVP